MDWDVRDVSLRNSADDPERAVRQHEDFRAGADAPIARQLSLKRALAWNGGCADTRPVAFTCSSTDGPADQATPTAGCLDHPTEPHGRVRPIGPGRLRGPDDFSLATFPLGSTGRLGATGPPVPLAVPQAPQSPDKTKPRPKQTRTPGRWRMIGINAGRRQSGQARIPN